VQRRQVQLWSEAIGASGEVLAFGHWGRPVLCFPTLRGLARDLEERGIVDAVAPLIEAGRVKLYCVDAFDRWSWQHHEPLTLEERALRHGAFETWVVDVVVPWIEADLGGRHDIVLIGPSFGAYHAVNLALRRADRFPVAIGLSGVYDVSIFDDRDGHGRGDAVYFNNPVDYVANLGGEHLDWLRSRLDITLVAGQGAWEDSTGALDSTRRLAALVAQKGIRHRLDLWGHDTPHDWPSWRAQLAHHLPRFC
jgi:esterase/lipase superfamily enzyme